MTIQPGNYNITIYQGADMEEVITWRDDAGNITDLTGFSARMMIRESIDSATPFMTLSTDNGKITLGGTAGTISISTDSTGTASLTQSGGVYDLEIISSGGKVYRLLEGSVTIDKEVTR